MVGNDIQGGAKICVKNIKVSRGDLNKHISNGKVCAVMTH